MIDSYIQAIAIITSNLIIMLTFFGMSISMHNALDKKLDENRKETNDILRAIQQEMKDFHGRLCTIEEKNKGK